MLIKDPLLYHTFFDIKGDKQVIKHSRFLKVNIFNFKQIIEDLLINILSENHKSTVSFLRQDMLHNPMIPGMCGESQLLQYLENYIKHLVDMSDYDIKFSLDLKYKGVICGFHKYEIELK